MARAASVPSAAAAALAMAVCVVVIAQMAPAVRGDNAARVRRDEALLLEAEAWLATREVSKFMTKQIVKVAEALKYDPLKTSYGVEFSPKLGNVDEVRRRRRHGGVQGAPPPLRVPRDAIDRPGRGCDRGP